MTCDHCRAPDAPHTWDLRACAADGEEHRVNLCASCDLALNAIVLRFVRAPMAEAMIETYAAERRLAVPLDDAAASCCRGGPQWGHAWDCPKCPD